MIPSIDIDPIEIWGRALSPFGMLMAAGMIIGYELSMRRGRRLGIDLSELRYFFVVIAVFGVVGAHALDFLRETDAAAGDIRYGGLTPAQWACFLLFVFGIGLGIHLLRGREARSREGGDDPSVHPAL
jgi:prolipoprotein diacylglyceryltransferase